MKRSLFRIIALVVVIGGILGSFAAQGPGSAQIQPVYLQKSQVGPGGSGNLAYEGSTVNATIRFTNLDNEGHPISLDSLCDTIHHKSGDEKACYSPTPVILPNYGDYVDFSHTYVVEVGDNDPLIDEAEAVGVDLGTGQGFNLKSSGMIQVIHPNTSVAITANPSVVIPGDSVKLTIKEANTGDVPLTSPYVMLDPLGNKLEKISPAYVGGDTDGDGVLDPGETWNWEVIANVYGSTTYTATGHGIDPLGKDITYPEFPSERDVVAVTAPMLQIEISLTAGWNMVSVPVLPADTSIDAVFPGVAAVYAWDPVNRAYFRPTVLKACGAYWVAVAKDICLTVTGSPITKCDDCPTISCYNNSACNLGNYCEKAPGDCNGMGACVKRPFFCSTIYDPVCGCDGVTYSNAGCASVAGVNIAHSGECAAVP